MSFNDIGKFSDIIKGINSINKSSDVISQAEELVGFINDLTNFDDVSKVLNLSDVSRDVAEAALRSSVFKDELDKVVDTTTGLKAGEKALQGLSREGKTVENVFTGLVTSISNTVKGIGSFMIKNPISFAVAGLAAATLVASQYIETYDTLKEKATNSISDLSSTRSEISNVESELSSVKSQIEELEAFDGLTLAQKGELEKLRQQNDELKRQKAILEATEKGQEEIAAKDAATALNKEKISKAESQKSNDAVVHGTLRDASEASKNVKVTTVDQNVLENIEALKTYEKQLQKTKEEQANTEKIKYNSKAWKDKQEDIDDLTEKINELDKALSTDLEDLQSYRDALTSEETGKAITGYEDEVKRIDEALDKYSEYANGISTTKAEKLDEILGAKFKGVNSTKDMSWEQKDFI